MKNPEFNLLDEPWIPVRLLDGTIADVGLLELLRRTTDIADLACELPTQSIAIQRLVLAIAYRVAPPGDARDWARQWDDGAPTERMIEYLERWRDRFFLFGGRFPFMQVADLRTAKDSISGLEKLIADVPNGEQFFTTRHGRALACIPPSEAARWLVHAQAYDPSGIRSGAVGDSQVKGGKGYPIGPSWCGHLGLVWLKGKDLDETLVLNLIPADAAVALIARPNGEHAAGRPPNRRKRCEETTRSSIRQAPPETSASRVYSRGIRDASGWLGIRQA